MFSNQNGEQSKRTSNCITEIVVEFLTGNQNITEAQKLSLIENTDYNITQVAEAVGYDNSMYFSRLFKKHTGMSPTEYKNKNHS